MQQTCAKKANVTNSPRPSDMELEGAPLPSAGSPAHPLSSAMMGMTGFVLVYTFMAMSVG
jgi:hypothetical protein